MLKMEQIEHIEEVCIKEKGREEETRKAFFRLGINIQEKIRKKTNTKQRPERNFERDASVFSSFSLSSLLSIQALPSQTENKTRNLTLNIEIPWVGMACVVAYHLQISGN